MISKAKIAEIRQLHLKKYRVLHKLFLVEGVKSVHDLLQSDFRIKEIFSTENIYKKNHSWLQNQLITEASPSEMARLSTLDTSPDILAVVEQPTDYKPFSNNRPILVLDRIADPGNLGTIVRTADWFDITQIVCSPDCVEFYNPKTIQATMGSFCHVHLQVQELVPFLQEQSKFRQIVGTFLEGDPIQNFHFKDNDILVIGSESHGISPEVAAVITHPITIPTFAHNRPHAESLNAAIASALTMAAFRK